MKKIDLVLVGADRVCPDHFVNKTGTLSLALLAKEYQIPFYVLIDSRKIVLEEQCRLYEEHQKDFKELWENPKKNVILENYYFEPVPNSLVTGFITEKGLL